jgi:hypothetical protein
MTPSRSGHLPINGLELYYEVHGELSAPEALPLLLIPGAFLSTDSMAQWVAAFVAQRPSSSSINRDTVARRMRSARCHTSSSATMPRRCCRRWTSSGPT